MPSALATESSLDSTLHPVSWLRDRPDIITALVPMPLHLDDGPAAGMPSLDGTDTLTQLAAGMTAERPD